MRVLIALLGLLAVSCTAPSTTRRVLTEQGFTNIEAGGYDFFGCGRDDSFATKFTAVGPTGKPVRGVVCSGWFKGATIRFH